MLGRYFCRMRLNSSYSLLVSAENKALRNFSPSVRMISLGLVRMKGRSPSYYWNPTSSCLVTS